MLGGSGCFYLFAKVAERALFLWNNEHLVTVGILSLQYPNSLLPIIYGPLRERSTRHWNTTVESLANNVLRMYSDQDAAAYERCVFFYHSLFLLGSLMVSLLEANPVVLVFTRVCVWCDVV